MANPLKGPCFTDIHYGLKQNSRQHPKDANFDHWFIAEPARDCEMFPLGDWHS